uniref:Uncharacterized protein n=1 Tax=Heliothis virescens TaxID=7102 RepID=A0A2A4J7Y1_HELVI
MSYLYLFYIFLLCLLDCYYCLRLVGGWEYLNIHCRDNDNEPVDWWYVYKPPSNLGRNMNSGANFSYITATSAGRWQASRVTVFGKSMLKYTLAPMLKGAYADYIALVVYEEQEPSENFKGSASLGLMMANEMGGVWIEDTPIFPTQEIPSGHMIMCLSLDLRTMNSLAIAIKQTEPHIKKMFIPATLKENLPDWVKLLSNDDEPEVKASKTAVRKTKILPFVTKGKSLRGIMLARSPGDSRCLYKSFAKTKGIVMDVYGHTEHRNGAYADYIALVVYEEQEPSENFKGSASLGLMMANEMGGVWIGHTVPGFPGLTKDTPIFPTQEIPSGHMIMCLSLDLRTMNSLAIAIKQTEPHIKKMFIPATLKENLPDWVKLLSNDDEPEVKASKTAVRKTKILPFVTKGKSLRGIMLARSPGDSRCLYKSFAKTKGIVMDVYGHTEHRNVICDKSYSLRSINAISMKFPDAVYYIDNETDSMGFAVSTVGTWQRKGRSKDQYWACTGNVENQPLGSKGGIIACVFNFQVWLTFDNFKVKEPDCE